MKYLTKQRCIRLLALLLTAVMAFCAIPMVAYAEEWRSAEASATSDASDTSASASNAEGSTVTANTPSDIDLPIVEVVELREESVKHFRLPDGTYVAAQYPSPVHVQDENGAWVDIDNALTEDGTDIQNANARIKFSKKITGNKRLYTLKDGEYQLTLSLLGAIKGTVGVAQNVSDAEEDTELQKMMHLEKLRSRVLYADILDGVDIEYIVNSLNIKENILVKERLDSYTFSFELKLNGLTATLDASGNVLLTDASTETVVYRIPAPVVYDAGGTYAPSDAAYYTLTDSGNGKYTLTVTVSDTWMNDASRAFPVTVDPTVETTLPAGDMIDTYIESGSSTNHASSSTLSVSNTQHAYWKIDTELLKMLGRGHYISHAELHYYGGATGNIKIGAYEVNQVWSSTLTWANAYSNENMLASFPTDAISVTSTKAYYSWDVTEGIAKACRGEDFYGFAFKPVTGEATNATATFTSVDGSANSRPVLSVYYASAMGTESYFPLISQSAGLAGTGSVNLATGNLTFTIDTLTTTDYLMPMTLSLVYNSALAGKQHLDRYNSPYQSSHMPYGFQMNVQQTVYIEYIDGVSMCKRATYIDGDGTEHYFEQAEYLGDYYDRSGQGRTMDYYYSYLVIRHRDGTTLMFSPMTESENGYVSSWYLSRIEDANGNNIIIRVNGEYMPTEIALQPCGVGDPIPMLSILYNNNIPYAVVSEATKEGVIFRYSSTYNGSIDTTAYQYLRQVIRAHGTADVTTQNWLDYYTIGTKTNVTIDRTLKYEYDEGLLCIANEVIGAQHIGLWYTYEESNAVYYIKERLHNIIGQELTISYGPHHSDVRMSGTDDIYNTTDDTLTRYILDDLGRASSVYSTSIDGTKLYGAQAGIYSDQEAAKNSFSQVVSGSAPVNYLLNGSFEDQITGYTTSGAATRVDPAWATYGQYALKLTPTKTQSVLISQDIELTSGDYTFSMLVYSYDCGAVTGTVSITSPDGNTVYASESIPLNKEITTTGPAYVSVRLSVEGLTEATKCQLSLSFSTTSTTIPMIQLDGLMLEKQLANPGYSLVQYGGFTPTAYNGDTFYQLSAVWKEESGSSSYETRHTPLGPSLRVAADGSVYQTVFEATSAELAAFDPDKVETGNITGEQYVLSAFGMSTGAIASGEFTVKAVVYYYQGEGKDDKPIDHTIPFTTTDDGAWQYGMIFVPTRYKPTEEEAEDYSFDCIREIRIYCTYTDQVSGTYAYFDNIAFVRTAGSNADTQEYNEKGLVTKSIDADGTTTYYEYDSNDQVTRIVNDRGELVDITYDTTHTSRVMEQTVYTYTFNSSSMSSYPYDAANPDAQITKTKKTKTSYTYNAYGQCIENKVEVYADDGVTVTDTMITSALFVTYYKSCFFGRTIKETDAYGGTTHYFYDEVSGDLIAVTYPEGNGVVYSYNAVGQLVGVRPAVYQTGGSYTEGSDENYVVYEYDPYHRLSSIQSEKTTYTFSYDGYGNVSSAAIGSSTVVSYIYNDHNGKLNTLTYANGYTEDYVYDDLDRLTEIWYTQGSGTRTLAYSYVYTADGALASFTDHRTDQQTVYQYDISGRLTHVATLEDDAYVLKTDYIYDDLSQLSRQTHTLTYATAPYWSDSSTDTLSFYDWYMYDTEGRLSRVITGGNGLGVNTYYHYDSLGRATAKFFIAHDNGYKNDVFYTYQTKNDLSGMLVSEYRSNVCGVDVNEYRYTYDKNGNILTIRNDYATGQANYVYDEFDQLISEVNYDLGKTYTYTYDNAGNITSVTTKDNSTGSSYTETYNYYSATTGRGDRLSSITLNEYESISLSYDALGNVSHYIIPFPYENVTLTWEGRQLVSFFPDDNGDYPFCYTYDDEGRRVQKSTEGQIYTNYVYEGDLLLYETGTYGTIVYIYDGGSTPIGMMYRASSETATWQFFWYEKNLQGDVVAVYSHDGVKLVSYVYDAWGNTITTYHNGGSSTGAYYNPIRYRSYYYDREIELYYLGTRWYSPRFHRFLSPDNVDVTAATPGGLTDKNLYAYCDNNPVMRVDYTGEFWHIIIGGLVGAFVSAAANIVEQMADDESIDWRQVGIAAGAGLLSGTLATVGVSPALNVFIQTAGNAIISAGESIASQAVASGGDKIDFGEVLFSAVVGGLTNAGNGLSRGVSKHLMTQGINATKQIPKKGLKKAAKFYFSQTNTMFYKPLLRDSAGEIIKALFKNKPSVQITVI